MSQLDTADCQTAAGEEPSETMMLTKTRLKEKLSKLEEELKRLAAIEKVSCLRVQKAENRTTASTATLKMTVAIPAG